MLQSHTCSHVTQSRVFQASLCRSRLVMRLLLALVSFVALLPCLAQQTITTYAGGGPNNLPAKQANLPKPEGIVQDGAGNVYIADSTANRVYKVDTSGTLTVLAGDGRSGETGDSGPAPAAELTSPNSVAVDGAGNVYIADQAVIREVHAADGTIATVAGGGTNGLGDGGPARLAQISPNALAADATGNLYIASNQRIRYVDASSHLISTIAGGGVGSTQALQTSLNDPTALALDANGNLYIADQTLGEILQMNVSSGAIVSIAGGGNPNITVTNGAAAGSIFIVATGLAVGSDGSVFAGPVDGFGLVIKIANGVVNIVAGGGGGSVADEFGGLATHASIRPFGIAVQPNGTLLISDSSNLYTYAVDTTDVIAQFAGNGTATFSGENVAATDAAININFQRGTQMAVDGAGNLFFADTLNNRVREVIAATGKIVTIAGNGVRGSLGDGGPANQAEIFSPQGVGVDGAGDVFIADGTLVREVVAATGIIKTVAGGGTNRSEGAPALQASISPQGVTADPAGDLFINNNGCGIKELNSSTGDISTYAGCLGNTSGDNGPATAADARPSAMVLDASGNLYFSDWANNEVRKIDAKTGIVTAVAGGGSCNGSNGDGGLALSACFRSPSGLAFDAAGNMYIADEANNQIRRVDGANNIVETIAGTGAAEFSGDGGPGFDATMDSPEAVAVDASGNLYILDQGNNRIRKVIDAASQPVAAVAPTSVAFGNQLVGQGSPISNLTLSNTGTGNLDIATIALSGANAADFAITAGTTCANGQVLVGGATCTLALSFKPSATGDESATLTITDDASPTTQTVTLTGTGIAAGISIAPPSVSFGNETVTETSKAVSVTVTNNGTADLNFSAAPALSGGDAKDFAIASSTTCAAATPVAVSKSCTIDLTFSPSRNGSESATLTLADNANPTTQTVSLAGAGVLPSVSLTPNSLSFASQAQATASPAQSTTLANAGPGDLLIGKIAFSGGFAADFTLGSATTCSTSATVASGSNCLLTVVFTPSTTSNETATLTLTDNGGNQTLALSGTGAPAAPAVSLAPATLTFTSQAVGTTSAAQDATLMNTGSAALTITSIAASGDFAQTNTCGASLDAGKNCTIAVTFAPTAAGNRAGAVAVTDNATGSPHTVALTGAATAPVAAATLSPSSLTFTSQLTQSTSAAQTVTLTNSGAAALSVTSVAASGDFAQTNTCGNSVAAGKTCMIAVTFTPTATGSRTGTLTVTDNASGSPQTASLSGVGADLTINPAQGSSATGTVSAGQTATYGLSFTPVSGANGTFALTCTGAPQGATCTPTPASITLSGSTPASVSVSVSTTARSWVAPPDGGPGGSAPWFLAGLALLLALAGAAVRRGRQVLLTAAGFAVLSLLGACGGGGGTAPTTPPANPSGTPAGTYSLTVTATSGSVSRSTQLTLTVQ